MLKKIDFNNYKAFDVGNIEIKPLTILLGANSVGKSSILQLLLMLQETANAGVNYKSSFKLNSGFVRMGESLNLIKNKDSLKVMSIGIEFQNDDVYEEIKNGLLKSYCTSLNNCLKALQKVLDEDKNTIPFFKKKMDMMHFERLYMMLVRDSDVEKTKINEKEIIENIKKITLLMKSVKKDDLEAKDSIYGQRNLYNRLFYPPKLYTFFDPTDISLNENEYLYTLSFLNNISKIGKDFDKNLKVEYLLDYKDNELCLKELKLSISNELFLSMVVENKSAIFNSPYFNNEYFDSSIPLKLKSLFKISNHTIFDLTAATEEKILENSFSFLGKTIFRIVRLISNTTKEYFTGNRINYVSPLRAHPKRYYFLDKARTYSTLDTLDGDAVTEILKENKQLKDQVNGWFKKFNILFDVGRINDVIHQLVVKQNSLSLDITDVGFGISQILPVIIQGFLSSKNSITLIEQPEIHLHPKMQSELADLFIDIALSKVNNHNSSKYLIIETHSEYLLRRLRRRIAEGIIKANNVAIYSIENW